MAAAYSPTKEAAEVRNSLYREIDTIVREAMNADGRLHLDRRAKRLLGMLHSLYDASITGARPAATEIRLRLLLIKRRQAKLARRTLLFGAGWIIAFVLFLVGVLPLWMPSVMSLFIFFFVVLDARVIYQHSRTVRSIRASGESGLRLIK